MLTFRRALALSVVLLLAIFFLYPRNPQSPSTKPALASEPKADVVAPVSKKFDGVEILPPTLSEQPSVAKIQQQVAIANIQDWPLKKQLSYQFPYDVTAKFPAYIWQTWKYTPASAQFLDKFRITEASWTEKHQGFVHEVITDQVALHLIRHLYGAVPDVLDAYESLPLPILKADFFRYLILLARGGIYADIDTLALKSATEWISDTFRADGVGLVVGIEADPDRPDWSDWYSRRIQFCQWTIQSKPGHPILQDIIEKITVETLKRKKAGKLVADHDNVVEFTGPAVWTDSVFEYFNNPDYFDMSVSQGNISYKNFTGMTEPKKVGDVVVLPITSFSPGIGHSGSGTTDDPMAFVKHEFEGSWKPEEERIIKPHGT